MTQEKTFIKNRKGLNISVLIEKSEEQKSLVFIMHGLGGFKEQLHIQAFADAFLENSYTVIRFDTTNSIGESGGLMENVTVTSYYEDLEDVLAWAKSQPWYEEPFVLAGHSLGGLSITLYAEKHPEKIKGLAPISSVVSGKLNIANYPPEYLENWKRVGYIENESVSKPGVMKRINWSYIEDGENYDVLPEVSKLTMPVLLIVGEKDVSTPLQQQKLLYDKLPGKKELHIIKDADHNFRQENQRKEVKEILDKWIKSL
ncbi:MAG: alpha/beta hydrolase [Candidatus Colwellbacteria bacterium]|nr:alpha/beta hydrolase [Candidatus Colwellbacteria bacterium]